jgi:hypothetical protein
MNTTGRMGIRFNDCVFSEPTSISHWTPPHCACLYALLVSDPNWAPRPYHALYFGEFGNNGAERLLEKARDFAARLFGREVFASVLPMPFSTTAQRWMLRNELIWAYNPPYSTPDAETAAPTELVQKLDELERRHHEETAELRLLFASAHASLEPPRPRRRIGFIPISQSAGLAQL